MRSYRSFTPFTDAEAWTIFKLAAFGEAIGWTLLIIGICFDQLPVSWHHYPVLITGQIHGTLFLLYAVAALITGPSLGWSLPRTIFAGLCSVPPYGSLLYEQISAIGRHHSTFKRLRASVFFATIQADAPQ